VVEKVIAHRRELDSNQKSIQQWATEASHIFGIDVKGDTVRKMIRNGDLCLQAPGQGMAMGDEAHSCMKHALLSNINLCQRNGDIELKESTIFAIIEALLKGTTIRNIPRPCHLWSKIQSQNSVILKLRKEQYSVLRRQMWTTVKNLDEFGFCDDDGNVGITFSEEQKRWIVNMDKTKFLTDGSDGGIEGRPSNSITMLGVAQTATTVNKASMSSTLMCGSNAGGEALPIHVMFSLDAQEENYQVDARLLPNFPHVCARFDHEDEQDLCAQVAINEGSVYMAVCCIRHSAVTHSHCTPTQLIQSAVVPCTRLMGAQGD
jgi:hypothetical protein